MSFFLSLVIFSLNIQHLNKVAFSCARLRGGELPEVVFLIVKPVAVSPPPQTDSLFSDA